jgi:S1-C subfamily serine protease
MAQFVGAGQGLSYLFPIEFLRGTVVKRVLETNGSVPSGYLGFVGEPYELAEPASSGATGKGRPAVRVSEVQPASSAANSGIEPNDIIVGFNDFEVSGPAVLTALLSSSPAGRKVKLKAIRDGKQMDFDVVLAPRDFEWAIPAVVQMGGPNAGDVDVVPPRNSTGDGPPRLPGGDAGIPAGFAVRDLTQQLANHLGTRGGVLVVFVTRGSVADHAGLKAGDVIVGVRDMELPGSAGLIALFSGHKGVIPLKVVRDKKPLVISVNLGSQQQNR